MTVGETCGICQEQFTSPRLLPCLHTFCQPCLEGKLRKESPIVQCPACSRVHTLPDGLDSLQVNVVSCKKIGLNTPVCTQHSNVTVADALFCKTCRKVVCPLFTCTSKEHSGHDMGVNSEMMDAIASEKSRISTAMEQVKQTAEENLSQARGAIEQCMQEKQAQISRIRASLEAAAAEQVQQINNFLDEELNRITEHEQACLAKCQERLCSLDNRNKDVVDALDLANQLTTSSSEVEVFLLSNTVVQGLDDLCNRPVNLKCPPLGLVRLEEAEDNEETDSDKDIIRDLFPKLHIECVTGSCSTATLRKQADGRVHAPAGSSSHSLTVIARSKTGKQLPTGGDEIFASWDALPEDAVEPPSVETEDNKDGTYTLTYNLAMEGMYTLNIAVNGESIADSPYQIMASSDHWKMNESTATKGLQFSEESMKVEKNQLGHASVMGTSGWATGVHTWTLKIAEKKNCYAGVSLDDNEALAWRGSKANPSVWCFSTNGFKYSSSGEESIVMGEKNSAVRMTLDCEQHTLSMRNLPDGPSESIELPKDATFYPWFHLYYINTYVHVLSTQ